MASVMPSPTESPVAISATKLLIDNRWIPSESGKTFATINPATGEEICQVAEADAGDVEKAVKAARAAFEHGPWRKMPASQRGSLLHRLADLIEKHAVFRRKSRGRSGDGRLLPLFRGMGRQGSRQDHSDRWRFLLLYPARTRRCGGPDHPLELSHADAGMEAGAGIGHRKHSRDEAG